MTDDYSRYRDCIIYQDGETQFFGARQRLDATPQPDDRFHLVVDGDRVDLLAYQYLGDPTHWWVICDVNDLAFPLDLPVGATLRIPSLERVMLEWLD
jgi:nucleoid-associated protein YgaU